MPQITAYGDGSTVRFLLPVSPQNRSVTVNGTPATVSAQDDISVTLSAAPAAAAAVVITYDAFPTADVTGSPNAPQAITTQNLNATTGVATAGSAVEVSTNGGASLAIQVTGTYTGALSVQGTVNGTTWVTIGGSAVLNLATDVFSTNITSAATGLFLANVAAFAKVRVTALAAVTGTATVSLRVTEESGYLYAAVLNGIQIGTPSTNLLSSAATTNATSIKASAGTVYGVQASNSSASPRYLKLYNKASAPTVGTDIPVLTIALAATSHVFVDFGAMGSRFSSGVALAITGAMADSDTTAIGAAEVKSIVAYA